MAIINIKSIYLSSANIRYFSVNSRSILFYKIRKFILTITLTDLDKLYFMINVF